MKFRVALICFGFLLGSFQSQATDKKPVINGVDLRTFPKSISSAEVLDIFVTAMKADPQANKLLVQAEEKLKARGIENLNSIFSYCQGLGLSESGRGYFIQNPSPVQTRKFIPGVHEEPWSSEAQAKQNQAFSWKIVRTPFLETMLVSDPPKICIHRARDLFDAYTTFVHELTHLVRKDPFKYTEDFMKTPDNYDHLEACLHGPGEELDATIEGLSAGIRLQTRFGVKKNNLGANKYFNNAGELVDEKGLTKFLRNEYRKLAVESGEEAVTRRNRLTSINSRIQNLEKAIEPILRESSQGNLKDQLQNELGRLNRLKEKLEAQPPGHPSGRSSNSNRLVQAK